ncbi:MAG: NADH-quinone oxidoreductase subunit I [Deltaproteobacteria bacterium]|nr:NADH-quinone oxidoreductase subunit I [Deltaproteobacteria bacterium]
MSAYFRDIFSGLWSLLVGMKVTLRHMLSPTITVHYPFDVVPVTPGFRGHTDLVIDPVTADTKCITCMMCERACPSQCITVRAEKPEGAKKKILVGYDLDFTKCSLCGNCVEVCPVDALEYSKEYTLAGYSRHDFHFELLGRMRERAKQLGIEPKPAPAPAQAPAPEAGESKRPVKLQPTPQPEGA